MFHIVFVQPRIAGNTGSAIRLAAATGAQLHLVEPLGFTFDDAKLRRAGLDYHDLAVVTVHPDLDDLWSAVLPASVYAFTAAATTDFSSIAYADGDVLMFGPEPGDISDDVLDDPHVTEQLRIPMLTGRRSLNLANSASIAIYEAWRQQGYAGATGVRPQKENSR